jgi:hypothetical protein
MRGSPAPPIGRCAALPGGFRVNACQRRMAVSREVSTPAGEVRFRLRKVWRAATEPRRKPPRRVSSAGPASLLGAGWPPGPSSTSAAAPAGSPRPRGEPHDTAVGLASHLFCWVPREGNTNRVRRLLHRFAPAVRRRAARDPDAITTSAFASSPRPFVPSLRAICSPGLVAASAHAVYFRELFGRGWHGRHRLFAGGFVQSSSARWARASLA